MLIRHKTAGFTIVELLIVIVVIGILAAVVIVAYNGVTRQAVTTSLKLDIQAMDKAQRQYMTLNSDTPITYDSSTGETNDTFAFIANKGNSIIVKLKDNNQYCIYGYNPDFLYPSPDRALIRSSDGTACDPLTSDPLPPTDFFSTVWIIGQRLEQYKTQYGYYPHLDGLASIGLVIKPNSGNANQQQLYCRNNIKAIYLQIDPATDKIYVYDTATHAISQPTDLDKLSLSTTCPKFGIVPSDPGYESTGIKTPDI